MCIFTQRYLLPRSRMNLPAHHILQWTDVKHENMQIYMVWNSVLFTEVKQVCEVAHSWLMSSFITWEIHDLFIKELVPAHKELFVTIPQRQVLNSLHYITFKIPALINKNTIRGSVPKNGFYIAFFPFCKCWNMLNPKNCMLEKASFTFYN